MARHLAKLEQDPAVQFARAIERGESPAGAGHFKGYVQWKELRPLVRSLTFDALRSSKAALEGIDSGLPPK